MDPKMLFLRYAFACAYDLFQKGKISEDDFQALGSLADRENPVPDVELLKRCFPVACINLYSLAKENDRRPWERQNVEAFWHEHHLKHRTPVRIRRVEMARADNFVKVEGTGTEFFFNRYNLVLQPGDRVYTHVSLIVEMIEDKRPPS